MTPIATIVHYVNCHSIVNKTADLKAEILDNNIDICALNETWIKQDDNITVLNMCPEGYCAISLPDQIILEVELPLFTIKTSMSALTNPIALIEWNAVMCLNHHIKGSFHTHLQTTQPEYTGIPSQSCYRNGR